MTELLCLANLVNSVNNQIIYAVCLCVLKQLEVIGAYMTEIIKTFSPRELRGTVNSTTTVLL